MFLLFAATPGAINESARSALLRHYYSIFVEDLKSSTPCVLTYNIIMKPISLVQ